MADAQPARSKKAPRMELSEVYATLQARTRDQRAATSAALATRKTARATLDAPDTHTERELIAALVSLLDDTEKRLASLERTILANASLAALHPAVRGLQH